MSGHVSSDSHVTQSNNQDFVAFPLIHLLGYCRFTDQICKLGKMTMPNVNASHIQSQTLPQFWVCAITTQGLLGSSFQQESDKLFGVNLATLASKPQSEFITEFYNGIFNGSKEDTSDIMACCNDPKQQCCHLLVMRVMQEDLSKTRASTNGNQIAYNLVTVASVTFQILPTNYIQHSSTTASIGAFIRWMATLQGQREIDGCCYNRSGLSSFLIGILQSVLLPSSISPPPLRALVAQKKKCPPLSVSLPILYTQHATGRMDHEAAILFWRFGGFVDVDINIVEEAHKVDLMKCLQHQHGATFCLVKSTGFIWDENPLRFPNSHSIHDIVGYEIFPSYDIPSTDSVTSKLCDLKSMQNMELPGPIPCQDIVCKITSPLKGLKKKQYVDAVCWFNALPGIKGSGNYDVFSTIGVLYFHQKLDGRESTVANLSARIKLYLFTAYLRVSRQQRLKGLAVWLTPLWNAIKSTVEPNWHRLEQEHPDCNLNEYKQLFNNKFKLTPQNLYRYGQLCIYIPNFYGSLIDIWFLSYLKETRDEYHKSCENDKPPGTANWILNPDDPSKHTWPEEDDQEPKNTLMIKLKTGHSFSDDMQPKLQQPKPPPRQQSQHTDKNVKQQHSSTENVNTDNGSKDLHDELFIVNQQTKVRIMTLFLAQL